MFERLTFMKKSKLKAYGFDPSEKVQLEFPEVVNVDMIMRYDDRQNVEVLRSMLYDYIGKNYEKPKQILVGLDIYLSVFKFYYNMSHGGLNFDKFEDIPLTLVYNSNSKYICIVGENKDTMIDMLLQGEISNV